MAIRQRRTQANYLMVADAYELLGAGFTELNESPGAQTSSKRYINQASATQAITGYEWATSYNTDQIISEVAINFIMDIGEMQKTGADTETLYVIVDLDKPGIAAGTYRARKFNVAVQVDSFDDNDGELGVSGSFLGKTDPIEGTFDATAKTFVESFTGKTLELSYTATGAITEISVPGITFSTVDSKFIGIPANTTTFTFIDVDVTMTATLTSSWAVT